ncbi:MAG: biotin-dependent carboxyltransferase family protein [Gammaproteobacteria bacterium]|uniref:5-oxoprolinase subunit C family protein n=1 Tax=Limnobacter sp. TaxID=2003368 RepID=UPI001DBCE6C6|nr:biotin-dependent carboxyltransferase family protein [Limnobacter sp.]MBU0783130.1 biotin-dependent carboxyltransferase family protein [Gammaproteobacteria bacterium]MBU0849717.1 biotin-dependent carboxyltransferase family protein [Gammaproteobacteria bacterium]MBU1266168.1 biotin-dependent carboxyltransferase family protein [Gammaproteobacteria bacterium]MBU1529359.1 biotin-dependent carboxyltransferase family protein [Gammaproteobacteria bacterium]MBU1779262.1 biotin-dependent carboxyltran
MLKLVKAQGQGIVSDGGRWGYQHEGVPVGGVLDAFSYTVGNRALGNADNAACLELMGQFDFVCAKPCTVLLANRGANALLNNKPVLCGQVLVLQVGDVLRTLPPSPGFWNMLCLKGGVDVPVVMGSRSTCIPAGFGGFQGRALQVGDEVHAGDLHSSCSLNPALRLAMPKAVHDPSQPLLVHCLPGPEFEWLGEESRDLFQAQLHVLGSQSSRMGYRLDGAQANLVLKERLSLRSHAVHPGIVQLPPSGQPLVLLSESQVTGGYPRIASVVSCDIWKFAHLCIGQGVQWMMVDTTQATRVQLFHDKELERYQYAIESGFSKNHGN